MKRQQFPTSASLGFMMTPPSWARCIFFLSFMLGLSACGPRHKTSQLLTFEQKLADPQSETLRQDCPELTQEADRFYSRAIEMHEGNEREESLYYTELAEITWETARRRQQALHHNAQHDEARRRLDRAQSLLQSSLARKTELQSLMQQQATQRRVRRAQVQRQRRASLEEAQAALASAQAALAAAKEDGINRFVPAKINLVEQGIAAAQARLSGRDFVNVIRFSQQAESDLTMARAAAAPQIAAHEEQQARGRRFIELRDRLSSIRGARVREESRGLVFSVSGMFRGRRDRFSRSGEQRLGDFIDVFNGYREFRLLVEGHTHSRGNSRQKLLATKTQAERVTERIRSSVSQAQVSSLGRGDDAPLASNRNARGRNKNERIDIVIFK